VLGHAGAFDHFEVPRGEVLSLLRKLVASHLLIETDLVQLPLWTSSDTPVEKLLTTWNVSRSTAVFVRTD
jgi:hypothetical protein